MTLSEFQTKALRTAHFPDNLADQYLEPGLSCEIWEVIGRRAKHVRDCKTDQSKVWTCAACREPMLLELGDVLWFAVVMLHRRGPRLMPVTGSDKYKDGGYALSELALLAQLGRTLTTHRLYDVVWHVEEMATAMGSSLEEVMRMNVAKLEKRHGIGEHAPEEWVHLDDLDAGFGEDDECPTCGSEPGQCCSDREGREWAMKVHRARFDGAGV